jgi:hypothetical protein
VFFLKKTVSILLQISIILFIKIICIDYLYGIILNNELTISYNFIQGWLLAFTNILFYYFCYLLLIQVINSVFFVLDKKELVPIPTYKVFIHDFFNHFFELIKKTINQKEELKNKRKILFNFLLFIIVTFVTRFKVAITMWFLVQLLLPFLFRFSLKKRFILKFSITLLGHIISIVSWILVTSDYQDNFITVIGGLTGIKSLLLYYNEYYIIWGVGFGFISLFLLLVYFIFSLKSQKIIQSINNLTIKKQLICGVLLTLTSFSISYNESRSKKTIFQEIQNQDTYPRKLKPFKRNEWLTNFVENSRSNTNLIVNFKDRTLNSLQNKVDYSFYKRVTSKYIHDVSSKIKQNPYSDFIVVPYHSIYKLEKNATNLPQPDSILELNMAKNEWESFQLIIIPNRSIELKDVEITFMSKNIGLEKIQFFLNEFVKLQKPIYIPTHTGYLSDPLIPMENTMNTPIKRMAKNTNPFSIKSGECNSVWCNIKTSEKSKSGKHALYLKVKCRTSESKKWIEKKIKMRVNIYDYTLPKKKTLITAFATSPRSVNALKYYPNYKITKQVYDSYSKTLNEFALNPCDIYSTIENNIPIKYWKKYINDGANAICLGSIPMIHPDSNIQRNKFKKLFQLKIDSLKSYNLYQYAYLYGFDEIKSLEYPLFKKMIQLIREVDRSIPIACTTVKPNRKLLKIADITIQNIDDYSSILKSKNKKKNWWYVCGSTKSQSISNFNTDYSAISPRILFWKTNSQDVTGFLYFSTVFWNNNTYNENMLLQYKVVSIKQNPNANELRKGKRWPSIPWLTYSFYNFNGDGQLFYPGKGATELLPSIRLINIRDGIEDYELVVQIRKICKKNSKRNEWIIRFNKLVKNKNLNKTNPIALLQLKKDALILLAEYSNTRE